MRPRPRHRFIALCVAVAILSFTVAAAAELHVPTRLGPPAGAVSWISIGDSYASGEGIAGTGVGSDLPAKCAQSPKAFGPAAANLLRFTRAWTIEPAPFSACTGAVIDNIFGPGAPPGSLWDWGVAQTGTGTDRYDVITISIGGNDVYFSKIVKGCLGASWSDVFEGDALSTRCNGPEYENIEDNVDDLKPRLTELFDTLIRDHLTDRGVLLVAGYPRLFAPSDEWSAWRGDRCQFVHKDDADRLGSAAEQFDRVTRDALTTADGGQDRVIYVSRLELFDQRGSHAVCGHNTEWLNGVSLGIRDGSLRWQHGFHPNELGHARTAAAAATALSRRMGVPIEVPDTVVTTPPTTEPPIEPTESFDIGDDFDAQCVVAWPTAPVRYSDHIEMRMSCDGVPSQFLFVDVGYDDPDLPVTPSTGYMRVRGEIVDIAHSELGFRTLIVYADHIDI